MTTIVVVGGGITGLCAARLLALDGFEVMVLEAGSRWGGKLAPIMLNGVRLDAGAESILARRPEGLDLMADLGLTGQVVHPAQAQPRLLVGGRLHLLPPSLLGVPTDLAQLAGLLSAEGLRMAAAEPELPAPALDHDVAIGRYVDERLGAEVTDRLLEPLLGAVYAGHARLLSFHSVSPELFQRVRAGGSLVRHAQEVARQGQDGPVFAGLVGGVSTLIDALVDDLVRRDVMMRSGMIVRALERADRRFRLTVGSTADPRMIMADGVLITAPAPATGRLLSSLVSSAGKLARLRYASVAVITVVVRGVRADASGVLVPPGELPTIKALTYSSVKWPWVGSQARERWGPGVEIIRVSVGRHREATTLQLNDQALLERTFAEARKIPGWEASTLVQGTVSRWGGGLPQYPLGHRDLVARLRGDLVGIPGLAVAGAALDGIGIAACLGSARTAVRKLAADLGPGRQEMIETEDQLEESGR